MFNAKNKEIQLMDCGIYYALKSGVYHCRYTLRYWLLPFQRSHSATQCVFVLGGTKGDSLFSIHTLTLSSLCQEQKVSGPPKSTVSAILRQQRDSLHHAPQLAPQLAPQHATFLSREWKVLVTRISSPSRSTSSNLPGRRVDPRQAPQPRPYHHQRQERRDEGTRQGLQQRERPVQPHPAGSAPS